MEADEGFADELALEAEAGGERFVDDGVGVQGFGSIGSLVEIGVEGFVTGGDDGGDADALGGVAAGTLEEAELFDEVDFTGEDGGAVEGPDVVEDTDGGLEPFGFGAAEFIDFEAEVGAFRIVGALEEFLEGLGFGGHLGLEVLGGGDDFAGVVLDGLPAGGGAVDLAGDLFDVFDLLEATLDAVEFIHAGGDAEFEDEGDDGEAGTDGEAGGEDPAFPGVEAGGGAEGPAAALSVAEEGDGHEDRIAEEEGPFCDPGWVGLEELSHDRVSSSGLDFSKRWKNGGRETGTVAESDLQGWPASSTLFRLQMKKAIFVVILVLAGVVAWPRLRDLQRGEVSGVGEADMATAVATNRNIRFSVTAAGDISPREQVSVRPEVNGRIAELAVDIGDSVARDALLFSLDDRDLQIEKESQEKETERAKLQLDQAERNYLRAKQLYEENLIAEELFEQSKTDYQLARNALERSQKSLDLVNDRIRKTRILAPFACTVLTRPVSVGQAVSGSGGFNSGTEVLTIADLNEMIINAHINQADVTRLAVEQQVDVEVEAVPGLKVVGTVERIAPQATIKNNIKGFATRILLRNVDKRIRPGMTANIRIPVASADNVVSVPLAAVFTDIDQETGARDRYVYVRRGGQFERRPVQVGISDLFYAEIQKGLESGEVVALEVPQAVIDGQAKGQASAS